MQIITRKETLLVLNKLTGVERQLPAKHYEQIHYSYIVQPRAGDEVRTACQGKIQG